jgi:N-acetylglucosaminyl-diphospho-decaprenol L-rhamnosyltransferase
VKVAAIVVHWNSLEELPGCLDALGSHPDLLVVVVDNASPDGGADLVRTRYPGVRLIPMGRNAGFGAGVNAGAAATRSEYVLALNPDTRLKGEDALAMAAAARDLGAAVVGPRLVGADGREELSFSTRDSLAGDFGWMLSWRAGRPGKVLSSPREVAWVTGACLMARRDDFEGVHGFDEGYFLYFEDADLCRRIRLKGGRVMHDPRFRAVHRRGGSSRGGEGSLEVAYRRSQMRFATLHRSAFDRKLVRASLLLRARILSSPWSSAEARARGARLREIATSG